MNHEKNISAVQKKEEEQAWVPGTHGHRKWQESAGIPQEEGQEAIDRF